MVRVIAAIFIVALGAAAGGIAGLIAGAALLEGGRSACDGAACADTIVRSFAPAGALLGALLGIGKARTLDV